MDIVVELSDGRRDAFGVALSDARAPEAERNLIRLRDKIRTSPAPRNPDPSFLAVLVGQASFCRQMQSGVFVIPITELGSLRERESRRQLGNSVRLEKLLRWFSVRLL